MTKNQLEKINSSFITEFSKTVEMFGLNPSDARLFVILYLEESPMTLDQMSEVLGKSKTSISTGIRNLLDLHLVERVWKKGVRKNLYKADDNLYKKFMKTYIYKWLDATTSQEYALSEIKDQLNDEKVSCHDNESKTEAYELYEKLQDVIKFHQLIEKSFKEIRSNYL